MAKISVLGAGSWGTALTWLLTNNGHEVTLWSIMEAEVEMLRTKREHTSKLPGVKLQESIQLTSNLEEAMADKDVLVLAVPSPYTRSTAQKMAPYLKKGQIVVNVAKGVEEHTLMTLSQIIEEELLEARDAASAASLCLSALLAASFLRCSALISAIDFACLNLT